MILAGDFGLLVARESLLLARKMGVTYECLRSVVSSLSIVSPLAKL